MSTPAEVVAGYTARTRWAAADAERATVPLGLPDLVARSGHIAEIPSGAGHFGATYARAQVAVTYVDGNAAMVRVAEQRARLAGVRRVRTVHTVLPDLPPLHGVRAVVLPHGALGQLAAQQDLVALLRAVRTAVMPGARLLAQLLDTGAHPFARGPHGRWVREHTIVLDDGRRAARSRRTHRDGDQLRVEFAYRAPAGLLLHRAEPVTLRMLPGHRAATALVEAGWTTVACRPGPGGFVELTATAGEPA